MKINFFGITAIQARATFMQQYNNSSFPLTSWLSPLLLGVLQTVKSLWRWQAKNNYITFNYSCRINALNN